MKVQAAPTALVARPSISPSTARPEVVEDKVEVSNGSDGANMTKLALTGIGGLVLAVPCTYASMAGGAIVGGVVGGALGPVTNAFASGGILSGLSAAWSGAGTYGHWGMALGGLTALVGAVATSAIAARGVGHLLGVPTPTAPKKAIDWNNWATIGTGTVLLTTGILAGAVGGLSLASGAAAAGTVLTGLLHHGFDAAALAGAGHNALIAGAIATPIAALVGGKGGATLTKFLARNVIDPATEAIKGSLPGAEPKPVLPDSQAKKAVKGLAKAALNHPLGVLGSDIGGFMKKHPGWSALNVACLSVGVAGAVFPQYGSTLMPLAIGLAGVNAVNSISRGVIQPKLNESVSARSDIDEASGMCGFQHVIGSLMSGVGCVASVAGAPGFLMALALGTYIDSCGARNEAILRQAFAEQNGAKAA